MIERALLINPFGIGDVVFSMALVEALKKNIPSVRVGFLGNERTVALLRMNASIDVCHEFNRDELRALRRKSPVAYLKRVRAYFREWKAERYDTCFDLSLGREFAFMAFLAGIGRRVGFNYKNRGWFLSHPTPLIAYERQHVTDWQLSLLNSVGLRALPVSAVLPLKIPDSAEQRASQILESTGHSHFLALAPGGGRSWGPDASYKQWSPDRFSAVANRVSIPGVFVLLVGDPEEEDLLKKVAQGLSVPSILVSGESLPVVAALLKRSRFLLCNDGGLLHLANALGVKTVSIFGPVDEKVYGPYGKDTEHEVVVEEVSCRPCYRNFHFPACAHRRRCQEELSVEKVLAAVRKIS